MKRGLACAVACGSAVLTNVANAQLAPGVASGIGAGSVGAAIAAQSAPPTQRLPGTEPPDWLDPHTGTTTVLARGCGVVTQVTLTVTPGNAYVNVLVSNESRETVAFDPAATLVDFSGQGRRRLRANTVSHLNVEAGWLSWLSLQLPSKAELEHQSYLDVDLSIRSPSFGGCRVTSRIARPSGPRRPQTVTPYSVGEFSLGGGARLFTTGDLHELGPQPGVSIGFDFTWFFAMHHGATLDMALETPGRTKAREVDPERTFSETPRIEAAGFFLGYVARLPIAPWLSVSYSPQFGVVPFQLSVGRQGALETSAVFCPRQRLRAVVPFARLLDGHVFTGVTFAHTYVPYGNLGEVPLSGNLLSGQVLLGLGG